MTTPARDRTNLRRIAISPADERVLLALNRVQHVTADQVQRLLYGKGRYAYDRLKPLVEAGYVSHHRLKGMPGVYALDRAGRAYLAGLGHDVLPRWHTAEESTHGASYYAHALAVADVLIAAELLARRVPEIELAAVRHDRELKHRFAVPVRLRDGSTRRVIPDGWLDVRVAMADGRFRVPVVLEVDRGTHQRRRWQAKAEALVAFAGGPYQDAYGADSLVVAVVATPGEARRRELLAWTEAVLRALGEPEEADLFRFTGADPLGDPVAFFLGGCWLRPFDGAALPLLEPREGGV